MRISDSGHWSRGGVRREPEISGAPRLRSAPRARGEAMTDNDLANAAADSSTHRALDILRGLLTVNETLEAWAMQHRLFALTHRRVCLAATSGRFISLTRRLLGGYD